MPRANRDYRAEYQARLIRVRDELVAQGVPPDAALRVARGHPSKGEPTLRRIRNEAKQRNEPIGAAMLRIQRADEARRLTGARAAGSSAFVYSGGLVLDTSSAADALTFLERVAGRNGEVVVIGTRSCGVGVPVNRDREIRAMILLEVLEDLIGEALTPQNLFAALDLVYPDRHDPPHAVVKVSITSVGDTRSAAA